MERMKQCKSRRQYLAPRYVVIKLETRDGVMDDIKSHGGEKDARRDRVSAWADKYDETQEDE